MSILVKIEQKRFCGYRNPGGIYLCSDGLSRVCEKLPIPLTTCPTCGSGIKFSRGFQWVNTELVADVLCENKECNGCYPFNGLVEEFGLMWVGEKFYPTPEHFTKEANRLGVSKRIPALPRRFDIGQDWILLVHRKCIANEDGSYTSGIFRAFKPNRIEYIVRGNETEKEIETLEKRGYTLIKVVKDQQKVLVS